MYTHTYSDNRDQLSSTRIADERVRGFIVGSADLSSATADGIVGFFILLFSAVIPHPITVNERNVYIVFRTPSSRHGGHRVRTGHGDDHVDESTTPGRRGRGRVRRRDQGRREDIRQEQRGAQRAEHDRAKG